MRAAVFQFLLLLAGVVVFLGGCVRSVASVAGSGREAVVGYNCGISEVGETTGAASPVITARGSGRRKQEAAAPGSSRRRKILSIRFAQRERDGSSGSLILRCCQRQVNRPRIEGAVFRESSQSVVVLKANWVKGIFKLGNGKLQVQFPKIKIPEGNKCIIGSEGVEGKSGSPISVQSSDL